MSSTLYHTEGALTEMSQAECGESLCTNTNLQSKPPFCLRTRGSMSILVDFDESRQARSLPKFRTCLWNMKLRKNSWGHGGASLMACPFYARKGAIFHSLCILHRSNRSLCIILWNVCAYPPSSYQTHDSVFHFGTVPRNKLSRALLVVSRLHMIGVKSQIC